MTLSITALSPTFTAHRWTASLRILEIDEIKTVPHVPRSRHCQLVEGSALLPRDIEVPDRSQQAHVTDLPVVFRTS